ncbi:response regulator [Kaistia terrae]|uniref:Response regulator n=1 Tax=Kaistia terrae TaxID=537017 RepID=A0ABW0PXV2_9HYPH|nr:response regulator transcription factor [Kaistia terrae]MCX5581663.1 response regulator transcription factor [Kaistia terrae]
MDRNAIDSLGGALPRVLLGDDHTIVAEGVAQLLRPDYRVLPLVADGLRLVEAALRDAPDLVITDISMPSLSGIEAIRRLRDAGTAVPILILSMHTEPAMIEEAFRAGAQGYVVKSMAGDDLLRAMRNVLRGGTYVSPSLWPRSVRSEPAPKLTVRQREVLDLLVSGLRSREIATKLGLSVRTVETHRQTLMSIFDVRNGIELVREATRLHIGAAAEPFVRNWP